MTTIEDFTSQYGLVEKIDAFGYLKYLAENPDAPRKHGKVILVTADTPLKASRGEGKTTTTIALIDALNKRGIDAAAVLRQPSMGITAAGSKGGASGGGKASLTHPELIDWGLCGEMGAIEAAQNLLVSFAEKAVDEGQARHDSRAARLRSAEPFPAFHRRGLRQGATWRRRRCSPPPPSSCRLWCSPVPWTRLPSACPR